MPILAKSMSQKPCKYRANSGSTTFGWQRSALEQFERLQTYIHTDRHATWADG